MSHTHARAYGSLQHLRVRLARDAAAPPLPRIHVEGGRGAPRPERARQPAAALRRRRRRPGRLLAALVHAEHHVRRGELLARASLAPAGTGVPARAWRGGGRARNPPAGEMQWRCSGCSGDAVEMGEMCSPPPRRSEAVPPPRSAPASPIQREAPPGGWKWGILIFGAA